MDSTLDELLYEPRGEGRDLAALRQALLGLALYAGGLGCLEAPPERLRSGDLDAVMERLLDPDAVAGHYPEVWRSTMRRSWCWALEQEWSPLRLLGKLSTLLGGEEIELRPEELLPRFQAKLRLARGRSRYR
jgi:hypothetical protein